MDTNGSSLREVRWMATQKSNRRPDLTILIPAYCEENRIGKTLDELAAFIKHDPVMKKLTIEVVVVSADSPDKTHQIVKSKAKLFPSLKLLKPGPKVGKGRDVQYGMLRANGAAVIFMDADMATPLRHLSQFYQAYKNGSDVVIATRNLFKHHPNYFRRLVSNAGNFLFRLAGGVWVEDSQCGFKMFSYDAARTCFSRLQIMGWGFDMEVLAIAKANGYKIKSYRVNDWISVPGGTFVGGVARNSVAALKELSIIFARRVSGEYRRKQPIRLGVKAASSSGVSDGSLTVIQKVR